MYKIGDFIFYQKAGICEITDLSERTISNKTKTFYVLKPVNDLSSTIYLPSDNLDLLAQIKSVLTKQEIEEMLIKLENTNCYWVNDRNQRKEHFLKVMQEGDCFEILLMLKSINKKREELHCHKKKLSSFDDNIYRDAKKMLLESFSYILKMTKENLEAYLKV